MRGRSALRLVGVVKTVDVRLELSDEISMYVLTFVLSNLATRHTRIGEAAAARHVQGLLYCHFMGPADSNTCISLGISIPTRS